MMIRLSQEHNKLMNRFQKRLRKSMNGAQQSLNLKRRSMNGLMFQSHLKRKRPQLRRPRLKMSQLKKLRK